MNPKMSGAPIRILLVEDSASDRLLTMEALEASSIPNELETVEDGVEAIDYLHGRGSYRNASRPDLILLDLNMPRKGGREVLAEIKADPELKRIPVIVLTTSSAPEDVLGSYDLHANCYINKPVEFGHFRDVVRAIGDFWGRMVKLPGHVV